MPEQVFIMGTIGFVGLWVAYHAWRSAVDSLFRQQLYSLRDRLFIEAATGKISFDDSAYGMLRMMMQRTLVSSKDFNVIQVAVAIALAPLFREGTAPLTEKFTRAIDEMPDKVRAEVYRRYFTSMMRLIATHLIRTMPIPIVGTILVAVLCRLPGAIGRSVLTRIQDSRAKSASNYVEAAFHLPDEVRLA